MRDWLKEIREKCGLTVGNAAKKSRHLTNDVSLHRIRRTRREASRHHRQEDRGGTRVRLAEVL